MRRLSAAFTTFALAAAAMVAEPAVAQQAMLTTSGRTLTGATGLTVAGLDGTYDVTFVDGTCDQVFGDCGNPASFGPITSSALALNAAESLIRLIDTNDTFDQLPEYTLGCGTNVPQCLAFIPYANGSDGFLSGSLAINAKGPFNRDGVGTSTLYATADTTNISTVVYAKFTASSVTGAVPEPSTWALMLLGFGAVGSSLRRRRHNSPIQQAA